MTSPPPPEQSEPQSRAELAGAAEAFAWSDAARCAGVTVSAIVCAGFTAARLSADEVPIRKLAHGAFSSTFSRFAPDQRAFAIWSLIYVGLLAFTVWQWLPAQRRNPEVRAVGWWVAASLLLNAAWLICAGQGWVDACAGVLFALALVLGFGLARLADVEAGLPSAGLLRRAPGRLVVDGTLGLYLGWACVATAANVTASLIRHGVKPGTRLADAAAIGVLGVVLGLAMALGRRLNGRLAVALAMAWGTGWIAVARANGKPASVLTAAAAAIVTALVLLSAPINRPRARSKDRLPRTD